MGLEHVAQLTQLTSLNLNHCPDHGHGAGVRCSTHAAHHPAPLPGRGDIDLGKKGGVYLFYIHRGQLKINTLQEKILPGGGQFNSKV